jgi:hypothetical protein
MKLKRFFLVSLMIGTGLPSIAHAAHPTVARHATSLVGTSSKPLPAMQESKALRCAPLDVNRFWSVCDSRAGHVSSPKTQIGRAWVNHLIPVLPVVPAGGLTYGGHGVPNSTNVFSGPFATTNAMERVDTIETTNELVSSARKPTTTYVYLNICFSGSNGIAKKVMRGQNLPVVAPEGSVYFGEIDPLASEISVAPTIPRTFDESGNPNNFLVFDPKSNTPDIPVHKDPDFFAALNFAKKLSKGH